MNEEEKYRIMEATIQSVKDMLAKRLSSRIDMLNTLATSPMDGLPEKVQELREREAEKTRAIINEQKDILELLNMLFPKS
jgi:hypothetical protein